MSALTDPSGARAALASGLHWLYEQEQREGAIISHHGTVLREGVRVYSFIPHGPGRESVVAVDAKDTDWDPLAGVYRKPLPVNEVSAVAELLADLGHVVIDWWNGNGKCDTVSFRLSREPHPSLAASVARYLAGCPEHGTCLCSWDGCSWYQDGNRLIVPPRQTVKESEDKP